MDEQLEVAFEGTGVESQPEAPVSPGSEAGTAEEKAEEALREEVILEATASETGDGSLSQAKNETGVPSPDLSQ